MSALLHAIAPGPRDGDVQGAGAPAERCSSGARSVRRLARSLARQAAQVDHRHPCAAGGRRPEQHLGLELRSLPEQRIELTLDLELLAHLTRDLRGLLDPHADLGGQLAEQRDQITDASAASARE